LSPPTPKIPPVVAKTISPIHENGRKKPNNPDGEAQSSFKRAISAISILQALNPSFVNNEVQFSGFTLYRSNRLKDQGGIWLERWRETTNSASTKDSTSKGPRPGGA
jgi:hypothetical protein